MHRFWLHALLQTVYDKKTADFKVFEINMDYVFFYKQQSRDLLFSIVGIEMLVNRSCQVKGCFGIMKQDVAYDRFRRTGLKSVSAELVSGVLKTTKESANKLILTALGMNIRKYMRNIAVPKVWTAPEGNSTTGLQEAYCQETRKQD